MVGGCDDGWTAEGALCAKYCSRLGSKLGRLACEVASARAANATTKNAARMAALQNDTCDTEAEWGSFVVPLEVQTGGLKLCAAEFLQRVVGNDRHPRPVPEPCTPWVFFDITQNSKKRLFVANNVIKVFSLPE